MAEEDATAIDEIQNAFVEFSAMLPPFLSAVQKLKKAADEEWGEARLAAVEAKAIVYVLKTLRDGLHT